MKKIIFIVIEPIPKNRILEKAKKYAHKYVPTVIVSEKLNTQEKASFLNEVLHISLQESKLPFLHFY